MTTFPFLMRYHVRACPAASADVLELATLSDARAEVAADRSLKELHHDAKERPREGGVPAALR